MAKKKADFDILIVGGGLVGLSLAAALRHSGLTIGMVEAQAYRVAAPAYDDRTLALAYGSRRIFEGIGVWEAIAPRGAVAIECIHVSDRGRFGFARLTAAEAGIEALGYVVPARALADALWETLGKIDHVHAICPATFDAIDIQPSIAQVHVRAADVSRQLRARLVIAADGAESPVRAAVGMPASRIAYEQHAIAVNVTPEFDPGTTAYERFTRDGPLALLPAGAGRCTLVWSMPRAAAEMRMALDDAKFLAQLQDCFGDRLGAFLRVGRRQIFPLALTHVPEPVQSRLAVIGNAAHTVHPVAGQGFNLGLRDVAVLAEILTDAARAGRDIGAIDVLREYTALRTQDQRTARAFTHSLVRIFSNDAPPLAAARNIGLLALDLLPPVKRRLARVSSGMGGRLSRLARGLPLG